MSDPPRKKISARPGAHGKPDTCPCLVTHLRVPLFEVDLGQALYHGNYYHLFELGREEMFRKIGFPYREFMNRQLHLSVIQARCKYRKPLRYDDRIEVHTAISTLGRKNLSFSHLIYRPVQDGGLELCAEGGLDMVCVQFTGRLTPLPEEFRRAIETMRHLTGEP